MATGLARSLTIVARRVWSHQRRCSGTVHPSYGAKEEELNDARSFLNEFKSGKLLLDVDNDSGIATLTIDNPGRKNGISGSMMVDLAKIVDNLAEWNGRALVIRGANEFFCSGGDLNTIKRLDTKGNGRRMGILLYETFRKFAELPLISVALIQGRAIGLGAEIATACDFRLMTESSKFGYVHINLNITPISGGATRLVRIVGPSRALEMMTSGRQLNAQEAREFGLSNGTLPDSHPQEECINWLNKRIHGSPEIVKSIKKMVQKASLLSHERSISDEFLEFQRVWANPMSKKAFSDNIKHR